MDRSGWSGRAWCNPQSPGGSLDISHVTCSVPTNRHLLHPILDITLDGEDKLNSEIQHKEHNRHVDKDLDVAASQQRLNSSLTQGVTTGFRSAAEPGPECESCSDAGVRICDPSVSGASVNDPPRSASPRPWASSLTDS